MNGPMHFFVAYVSNVQWTVETGSACFVNRKGGTDRGG